MPHYSVKDANIVTPVPELLAKYNCRSKFFPGEIRVTVFSKPIFNPHQFEQQKGKVIKRCSLKRENRTDSIKRARDKAIEICYANKFDYFITFTLDGQKIDRYDHREVLKKVNQWLSNKVRRNGLKYIIFPEYHKDGAIHFHGLCSGDLNLLDSGKKTKAGQVIYNADSWKLGFSTVVKLEEPYARVVNYIAKYITKDNQKVFGKYYLSGGKGLVREVPTIYSNVDFVSVDARIYHIPNSGLSVKYLRFFDN